MRRLTSLIVTLFILISTQALSKSSDYFCIKYYFQRSTAYIIKTDQEKLKVATTLKGHRSGVNCSFYNMNTKKVVPVGFYGRPFIILREGKVILTDDMKQIVDKDVTVSGGSWLLKNEEYYTTADRFSSGFKNMRVRRTAIGLDKNGRVVLIVVKRASLRDVARIMKYLNCVDAIALDGGSSSQMKYNGNMVVRTGRITVNYLITD